MTRPLVIVGCGGFGREVFSLVQAVGANGGGWLVEGFVDDAPSPVDQARVRELGSELLGGIEVLLTRTAPFHAVLAIGSAAARAAIARKFDGLPVLYPSLVHPQATLGIQVTLGPGAVVAAGARLSTNIRVGRHAHLDQGCTVGHDSVVGDFARLNPQACVSGSVTVAEGALVGANATVLQGRSVGPGAVVGAGAVVVRDVPAGAVVKGMPAR